MAAAKLHLGFPQRLMSVPVIHRLGSEFRLVANIHRANLGEGGGWIILEVEGDEDHIVRAIEWLVGQGIQVDRIEE